MYRKATGCNQRKKFTELLARRLAHEGRSVSAGPADRRADQTALFLGHLDRNEPAVAVPQRVAAELAQGMPHALEQIGVLLDEELHPGATAGLLVGGQRENDVAGRRGVGRGDAHQRRQENRDSTLHVEGASPPHLAVDQFAAERRMSPLARVGRNDVNVAVQEQRRSVPSTRDSCHEVGSRLLQREVPMVDSGLLEQPSGELDAGLFVARGARGVEPDQSLE